MKKSIAIFAALALVLGFAGTAMAADWNFYGSARMATFYVTADEDSPNRAAGLQAGEDETDLTWALQGNSRLGANVSAGDVGGGFEYGTGVNVRKLFGTWNFGAGELLVGQTYTPTVQFLSNQVFDTDAGLLGNGQFYNGRVPMLRLSMGNFKIALVQPSVGTPAAGTTTVTIGASPIVVATPSTLFGGAAVDTEVTIPKIEASYRFSTDMFWVEPMFGYQTYDAVTGTGQSYSVDAYVLGAYAGVNFGPGSVKFGGYFAQNTGAYGAYQGYGPTLNSGNPVFGTSDFEDNDEMGGVLVAAFTINDMLGVEGGFGYKKNEIDVNSANQAETEIMNWYVQLPITLADGVFIVPEVGMYDFGDLESTVAGVKTTTDQGQDTYFGAKWQINF